MKDYSFKNLLEEIKEIKFEYRKPIKLDLRDKKILYELLKNARTPINKIAKKIRLSRETTRYRIERMIKTGLILGFTSILNFTKLGYSWNIILIELKDFYEKFETEVKGFVNKEPKILKVMKCSGKWDLVLDVVSESKEEFYNLLTKIRNKCGDHLRDYQTLEVIKELKYTHLSGGYLDGIKRKDFQDISLDFPFGRIDILDKQGKIDKTDLQILKELIKNSRTPVTIIAEKLKLSKDAIHNRVKNLIKRRIINGFMPIINEPALISYNLHVLFLQLKNINNENLKSLINYLKNHPFVLAVVQTGNIYDLSVILGAEDPAHFNKVLMVIKSEFANQIKDHDSLLVLEEYKYTEFP